MNQPRPSMAPLIPLPADSPSQPDHHPSSNTETHDPYSPIFSSFHHPGPQTAGEPSSADLIRLDSTSTRRSLESTTDSDFGSFVSVKSDEHPLNFSDEDETSHNHASTSTSHNHTSPPFPAQSDHLSTLSHDFFQGAKERSKQNERRVLDELLDHQDDPLYWLDAPRPPENSREPTPDDRLVDVDDVFFTPESVALSATRSTPVPIPYDTRPGERYNRHHSSRHQTAASPTSPKSPGSLILERQPSLPTLSSTDTDEMYAHHSSTRTLPTTARKLLGDFLHSSPPSPHSTPSSLHHHSPHHTAKSINSFLSGYASKAITHATPFSREVFVPPTGAPGFGGDRKWNSKGFEFEKEIEKAKKKSVVLQGRREGTESVLSVKLADSIRPNLPALPRLANKWTLLYSLDQHGISLSTFYERCSQNEGGVLLVIKDADEDIFGAWVGEGLRESAGRYYGSGESFLWKRKSASSDEALAVYRWTGKNDYVALCDTDYVSFGGGDGHYGLYLSSSLIEGSSARCPTFDNDILCSGRPRDGYTTNFECVGIEVWAVSP